MSRFSFSEFVKKSMATDCRPKRKAARLAGLMPLITPRKRAEVADNTKSLGARCPYCGTRIGIYVDENRIVYDRDWEKEACEHQVWLKGMIMRWPDDINLEDDFEIPLEVIFGCYPALLAYEPEDFFYGRSHPQRPRARHRTAQLLCRVLGQTESRIAQYVLKGRVCFAQDPAAYVSELVELFESSRRGTRLRIHNEGC